MASIHALPDRAAITPPSDVETEAALLGAVLIENATLDVIRGLKPEHFFAPIHGRIYERILALVERNAAATPLTLKPYFENDEGLKELGGPAYLARLATDSEAIFAPHEFARQIIDDAERRRLHAELSAALEPMPSS